LMVRTLINLQQVDVGIRPENILTARVDLNFSNYKNGEAIQNFYRNVLERLRETPTVVAAGAGSSFPLNEQRPASIRLRFRDGTPEPGLPSAQADALTASPGYFQALGIPILEGRDFSGADHAASLPVVILNRSMARHYWGTATAVGRQISRDDGQTWLTVVGIVPDAKKALDAEVADTLYFPVSQNPFAPSIVIRTTGNPESIGKAVRNAIHSVDPEQPVDSMRTLEQVRAESMSSPRLTAMLLALFASVALLITATGIGGVVGYFVSQRRQEIGIRIALGAERGAVLWMVLREGMTRIALGILLGMSGAFALGRLMSGLLFGIRPTDPITFIAVTFVLVGVASSACFVPAYRAATIDPTIALRND
jgi:putative ABC transport system permease protein